MWHVVRNSNTRVKPLPDSVISAADNTSGNNTCEEIGRRLADKENLGNRVR